MKYTLIILVGLVFGCGDRNPHIESSYDGDIKDINKDIKSVTVKMYSEWWPFGDFYYHGLWWKIERVSPSGFNRYDVKLVRVDK